MKQIRGIVQSVSRKKYLKTLHIRPTGHVLTVPLSACVSKGDEIKIAGKQAWTICKNGQSQFLVPYFAEEKLKVGGLKVKVAIKEITEQEEYEAYKSLSEFHYRGHVLHGRRARLIMHSFHSVLPRVIGYVELATPFYMNKARSTFLDAPFNSDKIDWIRWDMSTLRKYIHVIVRIARIVVYPEFRGIGVGQKLVKHAAEFAKKRWQVAGYLPCFLEISADMLKYIPFAERAGMTFVGETEGNLSRVAKDMEYLISRFGTNKAGITKFEKTCGICDQQISRMTSALQLIKHEGLTKKDLIKRLNALSREKVLKDFALFHKIVSLPKPHYMLGLNVKAKKFIKKRLLILSPQNGRIPPSVKMTPISRPIKIKNLQISYSSKVRRNKTTHAVQQAFGISPDDLEHKVIHSLTVDVIPGEILLIIGPSGSGKTSLINALKDKNKTFWNGKIIMPKNARLGDFEPIRSGKPLIEIFGSRDIQYGLYLLGLAGLSEPFLYLKRFKDLSAGQQYRAMLAKLLTSKCNIWLADEFSTNLDSVTANIISHNIQRVARKVGATVITAAPHSANFIFSLKPDKVIHLTSAWTYEIVSGSKFISKMKRQPRYERISF
ncbi:MAG: GNAT family N-acetyltransferase [bacterium]